MIKKIFLLGLLVSVCSLGIVMNTTTPGDIGPFGILLAFIFLYTASLSALTFLIDGGSKVFVLLQHRLKSRRVVSKISFKKSYYYSTVLAFSPVVIVALYSVGAIGFYELSLVIAFVGLGLFYVSKRM